MFRFEFWFEGAATLLANIFQIMSPFILRYLLAYIARPINERSSDLEGWLLCVALFLSQNIMSFSIHHWNFTGEVLGSEIKASLMKLVFDQSLVVLRTTKAESSAAEDASDVWTEGRIVNLISIDASRVQECIQYGHLIWTGPVMVVFCLTLLVINLGYSILPGLALLLLATEAMKRVVRFTINKRQSLNKVLDRRVEKIKEALENIRFIKYYAWEDIFLRRILNIRTEELRHLRIYEAVSNGSFAVSISIPLFAMAMTFTVFSLTGHDLRPATVFSSLALFNCLRMPLAMVPMLMGQIPNAMISLNRIQEFLSIAESRNVRVDRKLEAAVNVSNATLSWAASPTMKDSTEETPLLEGARGSGPNMHLSAKPFQLKNLNLQIERTEFIAITGRVGSGKSSLLSALSGEMLLQNGRIAVGGTIAHCTQSPWVMSGTVKQNILFGKAFNQIKYDKVVDTCALLQDLDAMPNQSETAIGEKGITLSGGQKQRLALARAMYSECSIILLDDPLSAVDAKVGRHIFDKALRGSLLNGRCRIMATHRLDLLPKVDRIIWIDEGEIRGFDTFNTLKRTYQEFETLVRDLRAEAGRSGNAIEETKAAVTGNYETSRSPIEDEYKDVGTVSSKVYKAYASASGHCRQILTLTMLCFAQGASILTGLILAWWTSDKFGLSKGHYIGLYVACGTLQYILVFGFYTLTTLNGLRASKSLLENTLTRIFRCPVSYLHITPIGRLLSLFTRDVDLIDGTTASAIIVFLNSLATVLSTVLFTCVLFPWLIPAIAALLFGCLYSGRYYRRTARELKRHEAVLRSACTAYATEAIAGSGTISSYGAEDHFADRLVHAINEMSACTHHIAGARQWLGVRLDTFGNVLVLLIAIFVVHGRAKLDPSLSGLVMTYALAVVNQLAYLVSNAGHVEDSMVPVERMQYYSKAVPQEAENENDINVPACWPSKGKIGMSTLTIQYKPGDPLALRNVTLAIPAGGITSLVGRTGSGKSTLLASLFRMTPAPITGSIYIDAIDISNIPLSRLRSAIAIVPQDPVCWRGTIGDNVDPTKVHHDTQIESVLRRCTLLKSSAEGEGSLELGSQVDAAGSNLSLGQRQLLALARALSRDARLLILDEATSALDTQTNSIILDILKREVEERGLTVLFVAHNVKSVKRLGGNVVVLDRGEVVEEGNVEQLLNKDARIDGQAWFQELCQAAD